jgi:hypothetical protein
MILRRVLWSLLVLACAKGGGTAPIPQHDAGERVVDERGGQCERNATVTVHVDNQSSMDMAISFGRYTPARPALGFSRTRYEVPRPYIEGAIRLRIARGGLQVGTPPPIETEYVLCNDATLIIGSQPQYSFFYGDAPMRASGSETSEEAQEDVPVTVDEQGVMRWTDTDEEVTLFGVNYTTPFAYAYRAHGYLGADRKTAIDSDVLHFDRLGLDAYRIHVWDREVSDRDGNLVENEHLDLLDYLLSRLAEHDIKVILTPIAWWPAGYPEPDPVTNGLSDGYDKGEMTVSPEARRAQENYLEQFVTHTNPYTQLTYAEDPNLLALEIFNEPSHPAGPEETTSYIDAMVSALREAGFRKPIFYNISQGYSDEHGRAVCAARIQGVSHQWYPTGLVRNGAVGGNMLPNVDRYAIPYQDFDECRDKARMVYEFDAADVGGSYMYPAMARSFRAAGFQWATQFAYDPLALAFANTEYQTHYLNLVYTPHKAISFMIAGAAFRQLPRGTSFGTYPESEHFGPFRVSYIEDLSEMVTDTVFLYSNNTATVPPSPARLLQVAGVGSSSVVSYEGSGAYFLDRLTDGVWRLEVYPDVAWMEDPFTRPSLDRDAARVVWRTRRMEIALPDLGSEFSVEPVNVGNTHRPVVEAGAFAVRPGVYTLTRLGTEPPAWTAESVVGGRRLGAFAAPPSSKAPTAVLHTPPAELTAGRPFTVSVDVVSGSPADSVTLFARRVGARGPMLRLAMDQVAAFGYRTNVPADRMSEGLFEYVVSVYEGDETRTFPGSVAGDPRRWDFTGREFWQVPVVAVGTPILLFDARRDLGHLLYPHPWDYVRFRTDFVTGSEPERLALSAVVEDFNPAPHHFALRTFLTAGERKRLGEADSGSVLRIRARAAGRASDRMEVALIERDATAWGTVLELTDAWQEFVIPVAELRPTPLALLPRPYPQFLPYLLLNSTTSESPSIAELDGVQFTTSARLFEGAAVDGAHGFEIERVVLDWRR